MRRFIAFILMTVLLLPLAGSASAMPLSESAFKALKPEHVSVKWMEGNDSPTSCTFSYSVPTVMSAFFTALDAAEDKEAFWAQYGLTDGWATIQIDWALDDVNDSVSGWHYNKYWDGSPVHGFGRDDEGGYHYSDWDVVDGGIGNVTETINECWILRGVPNDDRFNGNPETGWVGIKDQLRADQYSYDYDEESITIDMTKHTFYVRARFALVLRTDESDSYVFSDWSDVVSCGKDAKKYEPVKDGDLKAPEITDLRMTDEEFNDNPVVAYTLTVPDDLMKKAVEAEANGGYIVIETYCRVKGDTEWTAMGNSDWEIKPGEMKCALLSLMSDTHPKIDANTPIELRVRYRCGQPDLEDVYSEYSKILTFDTTEIGNNPQPTPTDMPATGRPEEKPAKKNKCPLCHFCPRPLGLCIFIWLLIFIAIAVVVFIIIKVTKKDKDSNPSKWTKRQ